MTIGRLCAAFLLVAALGAAAVRADPAADKVAAEVARNYGVTVLRVTPARVDGRDAYAVLVMNHGGDDNDAFRVVTLVVDAASGALVPQFEHRDSGYVLPPAPDRGLRNDDSGPVIRSLTAREYRQR